MIKYILLLAALLPSIALADNLIKPGSDDDSQARYMFLKDSTGATVPAIVVYTSDGSGNIIPLSSSGLATTVAQGNAGSAGQAWFVQATSLPLPTNAAQESGGHLASIDSKFGVIGQHNAAGSTSVVIATDQTAIPITGNITASNASVGLNGAAIPTSSNLIGGKDGSGNLQPVTIASGALSVNGSGVTQPISASSLPLPTGASTSAAQTTANGSLSSIDTKTPALVGGKVPVDGSGATQPISAVSLPLPTGAATEATLQDADAAIDSINTKLGNIGQQNMAGSTPVVIASNQTPVQITGTVNLLNPVAALIGAPAPLAGVQIAGPDNTSHLQAVTVNSGAFKVDGSSFIQPVAVSTSVLPTGAATESTLSGLDNAVDSIDAKTPNLVGGKVPVDGSGVTQPISASSLPLPSGAATAGNQVTANNSLSSLDSKTPALGTHLVSGSVAVNIASDQVVPISASALPLPSGASTAANQSTGNASTSSIDSKLGTLGQKASAGSAPVVIASDQSAIPITGSVTATNASIGSNGSTAPASSTQIAGVNGSGNLTALTVVAGAAKVDGSAVTQPVSIAATVTVAGSVTANIGTTGGLALDATAGETHGSAAGGTVAAKSDLAGLQYNAVAPTLTTGQQAALQGDASGKLLTSTTGTVAVSNFPATQPVSGTVTANQGGAPWSDSIVQGGNTAIVSAAGALKTDSSATTQPVSAASLPLPTGAATSANQATANASLSSIDGKLTTTANGLKVDGSAVTQPVSASSLPLPSNAAVESGGHLASLDTKAPSQGQATMAASVPVAIASNQSAIPVSGTVTANAGTGTFTVGQATGTNLHTVIDSGTVTANIGTTNGLALDATVSGLQSSTGAAVPAKATMVGGTDGTNLRAISVTSAGKVNVEGGNATAVKVDGSAVTQPVSGTVTANAGTGNFTVVQGTGTNLHAVVDSGAITANIGTTNGLALDASVTGLQVAQGSTTAAQKGGLNLGAVTTGSPTYTTATTQPLSLTTAGGLRTDSSATTQPISAAALPLPSNAAQETGGNLAGLNAKFGSLGQKASAGSAPVVIASDQSAISVAQSGNFNVRVQDTAGTGINSQAIGGSQYLNVVQPSTSTPASAVPTRSTEISGQDGSGNARNISTDTSGNVNMNVLANVTPADRSASGALTAACASGASCAAGSTVPVTVNGISSAILNLSGTWVGTVVFDCSNDAFVTFKTLSLSNKTGGAPANSVSSNGYYEAVAVDSCSQLRARMSAFTSGSATTVLSSSAGPGVSEVVSLSASQFFSTVNLQDGNGTIVSSSGGALNTNTKTALTANSPAVSSVGVTSAQSVAANASRKGLLLFNNSSATISVAFGNAAVLGSGVTLLPGGTWEMGEYSYSTAAVNAIAGSAASNLSIQEYQ